MKITVTQGMAGKKVEAIDVNCKSVEDMWEKISRWKKSKKNDENYRIAYYDRQLFNTDEHKLIIDFGDYSKFILVKCTKKEWNELMNWRDNRKVDLEV